MMMVGLLPSMIFMKLDIMQKYIQSTGAHNFKDYTLCNHVDFILDYLSSSYLEPLEPLLSLAIS